MKTFALASLFLATVLAAPARESEPCETYSIYKPSSSVSKPSSTASKSSSTVSKPASSTAKPWSTVSKSSSTASKLSYTVSKPKPSSTKAAKCPTNTAQPDGYLPADTVDTSVLVAISAKRPDTKFPNSRVGYITPNDFCTIFNLDLDPAKTVGKVCNLVFDFPSEKQAGNDIFQYSGPGNFNFTGYALGVGAVPGNTTYNNQPAPGPSPPNPPAQLKPGNSYIINAAPCTFPPGTPSPLTVSGSLCSKDTTFIFEQSDKKCPFGFYVILTDDPTYVPPTSS